MKESLYIYALELSNQFDITLESLSTEIKKNEPDISIIKLLISEIETFEDQLARSVSLIRYVKDELKKKKCQNMLNTIKVEYHLE